MNKHKPLDWLEIIRQAHTDIDFCKELARFLTDNDVVAETHVTKRSLEKGRYCVRFAGSNEQRVQKVELDASPLTDADRDAIAARATLDKPVQGDAARLGRGKKWVVVE